MRIKGFSLIEVLISLVIFTSLSLSMMNVFRQTTRSEQQVEKVIQSSRTIRNVTSAIKNDLQTIIYIPPYSIWQESYWHYQMHLKDKYESDYMEDYFPENNKLFFQEFIPPKMGFKGEKNIFYFTSPYSTDSSFSTVRVSYRIESCEKELLCLIRRTTPLKQNLSSEWDDEFEQQVLIKDIKEFQVEYFFEDEWKDDFEPPQREGLFFPLPLPLALRIQVKFQNHNMDFYVPFYSSLTSKEMLSPSKLLQNKNKKPSKGKKSS